MCNFNHIENISMEVRRLEIKKSHTCGIKKSYGVYKWWSV